MPKRHTRAECFALQQERHQKRRCVSIESQLCFHLGLPLDPNLTDPFPVELNDVKYFRRSVLTDTELGADEIRDSQTIPDFAG